MSALHDVVNMFTNFLSYAFRSSSRLWPGNIIAAILISRFIYVGARSRCSFVGWAFPKDTYRLPSHRTDLKLFALGQALSAIGFFKLVAATTAVAAIMAEVVGSVAPMGPALGVVPLTIALVVTVDFTTYWVHRLHHDQKQLWPFHSVHHSAEVRTPFTVYRKHPVYDLISTASKGVLGGLAQGLLLAVAVDSISFQRSRV